jgi:dolichyl-phosphate beta-glucosyltransferase
MKCSLILPCYNEIEHIKESLFYIQEYLQFLFVNDGYEIILIDDFSSDGTREFLRSLEASPNVKILFNEKNLGRGATVKKGLQMACAENIGFMDIDREISEVYIPKFVHLISKGFDVVVADRTYKISASLPAWWRHILSESYRYFAASLLGLPVRDSEAGYKFFSVRAKNLILNSSKFDDWFWDTECIKIGEFANLKFAEVPVLFKRNINKTSTVRTVSDSWKYINAAILFKKLVKKNSYKF